MLRNPRQMVQESHSGVVDSGRQSRRVLTSVALLDATLLRNLRRVRRRPCMKSRCLLFQGVSHWGYVTGCDVGLLRSGAGPTSTASEAKLYTHTDPSCPTSVIVSAA